MAMALCGKSRGITLTRIAWCRTLSLAEAYGWAPSGTKVNTDLASLSSSTMPDPDPAVEDGIAGESTQWNGNYSLNAGQIVEAADALAMADALERALSALPEIRLPPRPIRPAELQNPYPTEEEWREIIEDMEGKDAVRAQTRGLTAWEREIIQDVVQLCRDGEFIIG